jgi:uridine kinase
VVVIGITGGSGSGKTTVVRNILEKIDRKDVAVISQDSYYKDNSHIPPEERKRINFDHPDSIEFDLMVTHLEQLRNGYPIEEPVYDYITSTRKNITITVEPRHVMIIEGILLFTDERIRDICTLKVFVDAEADDRLMRIIERDILERGRKLEDVLMRYQVVKAMHQQFIEPTKRYADLIIPQGGMNLVAIDVLVSMIKEKLNKHAAIS